MAKRLKPLVLTIVELFSVFLAGAFVVSVVFNAFVFGLWGLDYLAVATPVDVLMSGLNLLLSGSLFILGVLAGLRLRSPEGWRRWVAFAGCLVVVLATLLYFGVYPPAFFFKDPGSLTNMDLAQSIAPFRWSGPAFFLFSFMGPAAAIPLLRERPKRHWRPLLQAGLAAICLLQSVSAGVIWPLLHKVRGYYGMQTVRVSGGAIPAECDSFAWWIGQRALVYECEGRIRVLYDLSGVSISPTYSGSEMPVIYNGPNIEAVGPLARLPD